MRVNKLRNGPGSSRVLKSIHLPKRFIEIVIKEMYPSL